MWPYEPEISRTPKTTIKMPEILARAPTYLLKMLRYFGAEARVRDTNKKGIEIPREYTNKSEAPVEAVRLVAARARIEPSTAPTHGDQATAKTIPIKNDLP